MVQDLSFIHEKTTAEEEQRVRKAVEEQCLLALIHYLTEVADTMEQNSLECLSPSALRVMAETFNQRLNNDENQAG